jgi:hypothetical protein
MISPQEKGKAEKTRRTAQVDTKVDTNLPITDPALARIIAAWPTLAIPIRRAMTALIGLRV